MLETIFNPSIDPGAWFTIASFLLAVITMAAAAITPMSIGGKKSTFIVLVSLLLLNLLSILFFVFCGDIFAKMLIVIELTLFSFFSFMLILFHQKIIKLFKTSSGKSESMRLQGEIPSSTPTNNLYEP